MNSLTPPPIPARYMAWQYKVTVVIIYMLMPIEAFTRQFIIYIDYYQCYFLTSHVNFHIPSHFLVLCIFCNSTSLD